MIDPEFALILSCFLVSIAAAAVLLVLPPTQNSSSPNPALFPTIPANRTLLAARTARTDFAPTPTRRAVPSTRAARAMVRATVKP